ncbi:MAG TPA: TetR/AcrR family transcriptional regulator [Patescibacteria group bacterium]|nr:TetR/AcrR family transcriptional regulator [Patescibacteria group bacterium]
MGRGKEQGTADDSRSKRQQILDAAYVIFSRNGYYRATVDEIIALAETGKGTVYNYFVNKEQLFYTLIKERSAGFEAELEKIAESDAMPLDRVQTMVRLFLEFYTTNAELWRVLMHEMRGLNCGEGHGGLTKSQSTKYQERFKHTIGLLEKVLQDGIRQKSFRPCEVNKAALGLFSVIIMMVFQGFVEKNPESIEKVTRSISDIFLYGMVRKDGE